MKKIALVFLFGALIVLAACTGQQTSPTAAGTVVPGDQIASPTALQAGTVGVETTATPAVMETTGVDLTATLATATDLAGTTAADPAQTALVPATGPNPNVVEGQFCIEGVAHTLLVLPDTAMFEAVADPASLSTPGPDTGCNTVDRFSGRQIVICRGQQNTSLNLNVCVDGNNCTPLLVELQSCTDTIVPGTTSVPGESLATSTPAADAATGVPGAGNPTDTPPSLIITVVSP